VEIVFVPWYILTLMWLVTRMLVPGLGALELLVRVFQCYLARLLSAILHCNKSHMQRGEQNSYQKHDSGTSFLVRAYLCEQGFLPLCRFHTQVFTPPVCLLPCLRCVHRSPRHYITLVWRNRAPFLRSDVPNQLQQCSTQPSITNQSPGANRSHLICFFSCHLFVMDAQWMTDRHT
jgi:hypothetical protein